MSAYLIPTETATIELMVKNSRFTAVAGRTNSVEEAKAFIRSIRNDMPGATHYVYAFKIGFGSSVTEGMSDDGEPSGTSGPPVLAVLRGSGIGDITIVVVRFFGGTKLGTGGLVSAYSAAAKMVLEQLKTEEKIDLVHLSLTIPYTVLDKVKYTFHQFSIRNLNLNYSAEVELTFDLPARELSSLQNMIRDILSGKECLQIVQ